MFFHIIKCLSFTFIYFDLSFILYDNRITTRAFLLSSNCLDGYLWSKVSGLDSYNSVLTSLSCAILGSDRVLLAKQQGPPCKR